MNLEEIKNSINYKEKVYIPKLKKEVIINGIEQRDGKNWAICTTPEGKQLKVNIRFIEKLVSNVKKDTPTPVSNVKKDTPTPVPEGKRTELEDREKRCFEALQLLGRKSRFIKKIVLRPEMESAMKKTMMIKYSHSKNATVRTSHYANTALIAYKIAKGIFPEDEELAMGVALCALGHDYRQYPFGHGGEEAGQKALDNYNAGDMCHNDLGATTMLYRLYPQFEYAINEEEIIENTAKEILNEKNLSKEEYARELKNEVKRLKQKVDLGLESELLSKINAEKEKNKELTDEAIKLLIISAGNHNGERGTARIKPDYSKTFDNFMETINEVAINKKSMDKLVPHTIADSIVKLSDQISSIPFDMIDGVRAGLEEEVPSIWTKPVSQILQISEEETKKRLKGNNKELVNLALELQDKLISSVIQNSNSKEINMGDLDIWLYGLNDEIGLRTPNLTEHIIYTFTKEEEVMLDNLFIDLTEKLSNAILDERGVFYPELNSIFRLEANNPKRPSMESDLKDKFIGDENLKDFYNYCVETTAEEYNFNKKIIKKKETEYFRKIIEQELKKEQYEIPRNVQRGTMEFAIRTAINSGQVQKVTPNKNGQYSQESIKKMMDNINAYLGMNPIDGIEHLRVSTDKTRYGKDIKYTETREITDDQSIAARMAVSYLCGKNDMELLELGEKLELISEEELKIFCTPYNIKSGTGHYCSSAKRAKEDYADGIKDGGR